MSPGRTICPECGAINSLRQEVTIEYEGARRVQIEMHGGKPEVVYGASDLAGREERGITGTSDIECERCGTTWECDEELLKGKHAEHRCTACDWWGFNPWQHGIERPDCSGEIKPWREVPA